ncbi:MAG: FAD-dependent 5-carboxymethylaminomethyl-2-thiouridine(34) oxidoreductase MnmC [Pseudomonadota bacterium]
MTAHVVLATGFGLGEHFIETRRDWMTAKTGTLHYLALVPSVPPVQAGWPEELRAAWPVDVPGWHRVALDGGRVTLDLLAGEFDACLAQVGARVDAFYLPAPLASLRTLSKLAAPGATLLLRGADEQQLQALRSAGFEWTENPAANEVHAVYTSRRPQPPRAQEPLREAIVIGAGLAGSAACERLAARGWQVTLIERHAQPAQEASGNRAGIFMPLLSRDDNIPTRLSRAAYLYALRQWQRLGGFDAQADDNVVKLAPNLSFPIAGPPRRQESNFASRTAQRNLDSRLRGNDNSTVCGLDLTALQANAAGIEGAQCGVLQLARDGAHAQLQRDIVAAWNYPAEFVRWLDAAAAGELLGAVTPHGGWLFEQGGWAHPASVCRAMLAACGPRLQRIYNAEALQLQREDGQWQVRAAGGKLLARAPTVIVANGAGALALEHSAPLPLYTMRGQVTHLEAAEFPALPLVVCREAYMTPPVRGIVSVGATYDSDTELALRASSQQENLSRARDILPGSIAHEPPLAGRVGLRCMAPDRLPLVGALPDYGSDLRVERLRDMPRHQGLYGLLGYASRGLIWAPLAAELLAAQLENEPLPLETGLAAALDPARFMLKARRR